MLIEQEYVCELANDISFFENKDVSNHSPDRRVHTTWGTFMVCFQYFISKEKFDFVTNTQMLTLMATA